MKVRQGFVSNSSTTSFCIYGVSGDESELARQILAIYPDLKEEEEDSNSIYELIDRVNAKLKTKIECWTEPYDNRAYVGIGVENQDEDETLRKFKGRVQKEINKVFGNDAETVNMIQEAWRDG